MIKIALKGVVGLLLLAIIGVSGFVFAQSIPEGATCVFTENLWITKPVPGRVAVPSLNLWITTDTSDKQKQSIGPAAITVKGGDEATVLRPLLEGRFVVSVKGQRGEWEVSSAYLKVVKMTEKPKVPARQIFSFAEPKTLVYRDYRTFYELIEAYQTGDREYRLGVIERSLEAGKIYQTKPNDTAEFVDIIDPNIIPGGAILVYIKGQPGYWVTFDDKLGDRK